MTTAPLAQHSAPPTCRALPLARSTISFSVYAATLFVYRDGLVRQCALSDSRAILRFAAEANACMRRGTHRVEQISAQLMDHLLELICSAQRRIE